MTIPLLAHVAFKRFLVRVNTLVPFQITRLTKTLLANITFIRFLVRVNTYVDFHLRRCTKTLLAHITFMLRPLSLPSLRRRLFFSYLLLLDFKNDFVLVRNPQTQHRWFFFFFSLLHSTRNHHRLYVYRAFRMFILSSRHLIKERERRSI